MHSHTLTAHEINQHLHALALADAPMLVLTDTRLRPLESGHSLCAQGIASARLHPAHPKFDRRFAPLLHELDPTLSSHSFALAESIEESLAELNAESISQGSGRRICGWLQSTAPLDAVAHHLAAILIHRTPDRAGDAMLNLFDPAVLWSLWPLLDDSQRSALLGPIEAWHLLDPRGAFLTLAMPRTQHPGGGDLRLPPELWPEFEHITAFNGLLREWPSLPPEIRSMPLANAHRHALSAMRHARQCGIHERADLQAFARLALRIAPRFYTHPRIEALLARVAPDEHFSALASELSAEDCQQLQRELAAHV